MEAVTDKERIENLQSQLTTVQAECTRLLLRVRELTGQSDTPRPSPPGGMSYDQVLYLKLIEECAEVQQRASKSMQFGADDIQSGQALTNKVRLQAEVNDLRATIQFMVENGLLSEYTTLGWKQFVEARRARMGQYIEYARRRGHVL